MSVLNLRRGQVDPRLPIAVFLFCFAVFFCGCKKTKVPVGGASSMRDIAPNAPVGVAEAAAIERLEENFARVHFEFDSFQLTGAGAALLDENASILARHPSLVVEIQGHADPRGSTEYNLALGARRAHVARSRLMTRGIGRDRLPTVTYGEERPLLAGDHEQAWAQNRRVEFRVVRGRAVGVVGTVD
ncbi:MAG: hypothetical protein CL927_04850 [Deltaproteobacteria bacterium]|nr:hypothetical protein [Deltaproteobacteria bacterium]HCH65908.1 hypothetical protein [Deltaproteobacteria bacterium]